jgi:hypothetical protein
MRIEAPVNMSFLTRRELLCRCGMGLGSLSLAAMLGSAAPAAPPAAAARGPSGPLAAHGPHFAPRARRLVHVSLNGGASHVDTFDPKPALSRYAGKSLPIGNLRTERKTGAAFPSPFAFRPRGASAIEVSDLFPRIGALIDRFTVIRSMEAELPNHEPSLLLMNCGDAQMPRPSVGSWTLYGLGTENQNLPGFVVLCPGGYPIKETENWQAGFLPGAFQGTFIDPRHQDIDKLIENIRSPYATLEEQRAQLDLLGRLNAEYQGRRAREAELEARVESFELAFRMQLEAADAFDVDREPAWVRDRYGTGVHARQTLIARRLLERGVRVVQLWHGAGQPWDSHGNIRDHEKLARDIDQPIAAIVTDLEERGMLDDTLILVGGEFGRTPTVELKSSGEPSQGRDHNPYGFSVILAGGGVRGGHVHGATDEFGFRAVDKPVHVHDLHATMLHLLGFDHEKLTYRYAGRDFRLTDVYGKVVREIIA